MQTKLTLRLDHELIELAKQYARAHDQSVSQLVANFFEVLAQAAANQTEAGERGRTETPRLVQELHGCLSGAELDETDYRTYIEKRYA